MAESKKGIQHQVSFTATETVSLPSEDPLVMGIRSRDWRRLRKSVEDLSSGINLWEIVFTVSTTIFFSFLLPALTINGSLKGWKLVFAATSVMSFSAAVTSLVAMLAARKRRETERADVIELMNDIQSLYGTDNLGPTEIKHSVIQEPGSGQLIDEQGDELYEDAKRVAYDLGKVSTSLLQRKLRIGYGRAARIVDRMEKEGIAGAADGSRPRQVFISVDELANKAKNVIDQ